MQCVPYSWPAVYGILAISYSYRIPHIIGNSLYFYGILSLLTREVSIGIVYEEYYNVAAWLTFYND